MKSNTGQVRVSAAVIVRFAALVLMLSAVLFITAGTLNWPMAWVYVGVTLVVTAGSRVLMFRINPELIMERAEYAEKQNAKQWDKALVPIVALYGPLLILIVTGLNRRFGWPPPIALWVQIAAMILLILGGIFSTWAMLVNRFFSAVVRIQTDRGHTVVSDGPYRIVRHPGYVGGVLGDLMIPLALGSAWALIPGALIAGLVVLRTALEDRTLQAELPGYAEYAQRTRYRLLPGVW
jgi:protein-S-isoprenylcysteine O-methyltransferase Ste14